MSSSTLTSWWGGLSDPDRIELNTRWSFYILAICESLGAALLAADLGTPWSVVLPLLFLAHSVIFGFTCAQTLDWVLDRREEPRLLRVTNAVLTTCLVLTALGLYSLDQVDLPNRLEALVLLAVGCGMMTASLSLTMPQIARLITVTAVTLAPLTLLVSRSPQLMLSFTLLMVGVFAAVSFTGRFSVWILAVVRELDQARHVQARLAVAEERLRFSRDLHDVLGRNLSVIALKSELAVQLAQRQETSSPSPSPRPSPAGSSTSPAMAQLVEVQRVARESQQELREVVRGYRDTGLRTELAGARGVLRAAGVDCQVNSHSEDALSPPVQTALGWVVREATTNVLRHADASRCVITLDTEDEPGAAILTVTNDGVSGRAPQHISGGAGLAGLRERLERLGGTLTVDRGASGGDDDERGTGVRDHDTFCLRVQVPVTATPSGQATYGREGENVE